MKHRLLAYAGLARPYRFERTLAVLAALSLAVVVAAAAIHFRLTGKLPPDSPRSWYFVYMAALVVLALLLVPWPRLAAVVLSLATLEAAFGLGTAYLYKVRPARPDGVPARTRRPNTVSAGIRCCRVCPSRPARPDDIHHNALGQRGRERTPQSLEGKTTIALFGGSTTYDVGAGEGETWGDRLEEMLGPDRIAVINHGMLGYSTAEHVIQTAFYERTHGVPPRCSIYYIGWNDLRNSHVRNLDPGYADFHLPGQIDNLEARRLRQSYVSFSPLLMIARYLLVLGVDTERPVDRPIRPDRRGAGSGDGRDLPAQRAHHLGHQPPARHHDPVGGAGHGSPSPAGGRTLGVGSVPACPRTSRRSSCASTPC